MAEETTLSQQRRRRPPDRRHHYTQYAVLATQSMGSALATKLAVKITVIDRQLVDLGTQITDRFTRHESTDVLLSLPCTGSGRVLAAMFPGNISGDPDGLNTVSRLAVVAGLAPFPTDYGWISGYFHRLRRFNRRLLRTCYLAALSRLDTTLQRSGAVTPFI